MRRSIHSPHYCVMAEESRRPGEPKSLCCNDDAFGGNDIVDLPSIVASTPPCLPGTSLRAFIRTFADNMIHEYEPTLPKVYLILPSLKPVLDNTLDVGLIAMIYHIIKNRNRWVCGDLSGYMWWQRAHTFVVYVLMLLAIADTALYIYAEVLLFGLKTDLSTNPKLIKAANSYKEVHLTYNALYLLTTIEIVGCVIFLFVRARAQNLQSRVSYSNMLALKQRQHH